MVPDSAAGGSSSKVQRPDDWTALLTYVSAHSDVRPEELQGFQIGRVARGRDGGFYTYFIAPGGLVLRSRKDVVLYLRPAVVAPEASTSTTLVSITTPQPVAPTSSSMAPPVTTATTAQHPALGSRIEVWWSSGGWFKGTVREYKLSSHKHKVVYDDGAEQWHVLSDKKRHSPGATPVGANWRMLLESPDAATAAAAAPAAPAVAVTSAAAVAATVATVPMVAPPAAATVTAVVTAPAPAVATAPAAAAGPAAAAAAAAMSAAAVAAAAPAVAAAAAAATAAASAAPAAAAAAAATAAATKAAATKATAAAAPVLAAAKAEAAKAAAANAAAAKAAAAKAAAAKAAAPQAVAPAAEALSAAPIAPTESTAPAPTEPAERSAEAAEANTGTELGMTAALAGVEATSAVELLGDDVEDEDEDGKGGDAPNLEEAGNDVEPALKACAKCHMRKGLCRYPGRAGHLCKEVVPVAGVSEPVAAVEIMPPQLQPQQAIQPEPPSADAEPVATVGLLPTHKTTPQQAPQPEPTLVQPPKWVERALALLTRGKLPCAVAKRQVECVAEKHGEVIDFEGWMFVLEEYETRGIATERMEALQDQLGLF